MPWEDIPSSGSFEDIPAEQPSEWDIANAPASLESAKERPLKPRETLLQTIVRKSKERSEQARKKGVLQTIKETIGNTPLDPGSMLARSYNQMVDYLPDDTLPKAPVLNVAGLAKGYASVPVGISRRIYSHIAPGSPEAQAAGQMASSIQEESQNYEPSALGEFAGQALFTAPLRVPQAVSTLGRLARGAGIGAGYGLAQPQWEVTNEQKYRETAMPSAVSGGLMGAVAEVVPQAAAKLSPYLQDPKKFLSKTRSWTGNKEAREVLQSELAQEKVNRIKALDKQFENALAGTEQITPNLKPILTAIDENLSKLDPAIEQDIPLMNRLLEMRGRIRSGDADVSVRGLSQWRRLIGQRQQAAFDSSGNAVQVTPGREHGEMIRSIKNAIDESIEQVAPSTAAKLREVRGAWHEKMDPFIPDELGQNPVERMMKTSTPDVEISSLLNTESGDMAKRFLQASTPKARAAVQSQVLENALQNRATDGPVGFYKTVLDKHGNLNPAMAQFFQGEDAAMLLGAAKIARAADIMGTGTNMMIGAGAAAAGGGAMFGAPGGGVGSLAGAYAGKRWLPNFTAGWWESAIRNPGTRGMLILLSKLPQNSPEFQKLASQAAAQAQAEPSEEWQ